MKTIITKEILQNMLDNANDQRRIHIVGHALVVLFKNQTDDERCARRSVKVTHDRQTLRSSRVTMTA